MCSRTYPKSHNSLLTDRLPFPCDSFTWDIAHFSKDLNVKSQLSEWIYYYLSFRCISFKFFFFFSITETFVISDVQDIQLIYVSLACYHSNYSNSFYSYFSSRDMTFKGVQGTRSALTSQGLMGAWPALEERQTQSRQAHKTISKHIFGGAVTGDKTSSNL